MRSRRVLKRASVPSSGAPSAFSRPGPEFLQRRKMDGDQATIPGAQDVCLRKARTIGGLRHRAQREKCRIRLDREMCHRLEHRDFDHATTAGATAIEQRTEHAVGRIDAGDCIGERRAEETRTIPVHHHAQESRQCLRHRVVTRTIHIWAIGTETADRAIHELRVQLLQALRAGAEPIRRARPEILDEHIGFADQRVEQRAIAGLLHVQREAALVAVVGLEVRRVVAALVGAVRIAIRAFHLDDVGAEIREHHAGAGTGDERALLHDAHALQYIQSFHPSFALKPAGSGPS